MMNCVHCISRVTIKCGLELIFQVSMLTFGVYVYTIDTHFLSPEVAFVGISLLNILRFAVNVAPWMMTEAVKSFVSLKRLGKFLNNEDLDLECVSHNSDEGKVNALDSCLYDYTKGLCFCNIFQ